MDTYRTARCIPLTSKCTVLSISLQQSVPLLLPNCQLSIHDDRPFPFSTSFVVILLILLVETAPLVK
jgi:hypothetical protein